MCGIFGYIGEKEAAPILLAGLTQLEYRGYDSSGIYINGAKHIKAVGQVKNLKNKITQHTKISGSAIMQLR